MTTRHDHLRLTDGVPIPPASSDRPIGLILEKLGQRGRVKQRKSGTWRAHCPAHEDRNASLDVTERADGSVLMYCYACHRNGEALCRFIKLEPADLYPSHLRKRSDSWIVQYDYYDEAGTILYVKRRFPDKTFPMYRPDGTPGVDGVRRVLYHLPELLDAIRAKRRVYLAEGEKDTDNLRRLALAATTSDGGAGSWSAEYTVMLTGADVVILPDNDDPGLKHAMLVADALLPVARSVRVLRLRPLSPGGDVSDWLAQGHTADELERLADTAPLWTAGQVLRLLPKLDAAMGLLYKTLASGPKPANEVLARANALGISERTIREAVKALGVQAIPDRRADGRVRGWSWGLCAAQPDRKAG